MSEVAYVSADDWAAVYVNGECFHQGHSIPAREWCDVIRKLGVVVHDDLSETDHAYSVAENIGGFPETYQEFLDCTP